VRLTQDLSPNVNIIRGYGPGELRINDQLFHATMIVAPSALHAAPALADVAALSAAYAKHLLELQPELVLIGTGHRQVFPAAAFGAEFLKAGVGFEVMDTGAACRTFNVLVGEQRRVAALLIV
jgi:uncharacterized protein